MAWLDTHPRVTRVGLVMIAIVLLAIPIPFAFYAADLGWRGVTGQVGFETRFWDPGQPIANAGIFGHMIAGAVITALAPLQLVPVIRRRWPGLHRATGYVVATGATVAGAGGLVFIGLRGTIGGWPMTAGFTIYGLIILVAAVQVVCLARARDFARHRAWGLRLVVLALASFFYRLHYGLWYAATGGAGSQPDFWGPFDLVQNFAFYLPYLLAVEIYLRVRSRRDAVVGPGL